MRRYSQELQTFLTNHSARSENRDLRGVQRRLFQSLKCKGEKAIKGRDVTECEYDVQFKGGTPTLRMVMEGRHSMSVAHQIARIFEAHDELEFVDVVKTKTGAKVVLRPSGNLR